MSLLKTLINNNELYFYGDYRAGHFQDIATQKTATIFDGRLSNSGLECTNAAINQLNYTNDEPDIGTQDFSVIAKFNSFINFSARAVVGLGLGTGSNNCMPMIVTTGDQLAIKMELIQYDSSIAISEELKSCAITANRDGNALFYENGVLSDTINISTHSTANIQQNNFAVGSLGLDTWALAGTIEYALMVNRVLTDTEVAQLTAELESIKFPKKSKSSVRRIDTYVPNFSNVLSWGLNEKLGFEDEQSLDRTENSIDSKLAESFCSYFDVGDYIGFTDLTGVHILGYLGSAVLAIDGNTVKATTPGTAFSLELSDGTFLPLQGSAYDISGNANHGTISGVVYINNSSGSTFQTWVINNN